MASECFCGCGREVPFGRKRAANMVGDRMRQDIALFEGTLERTPDPEHDADLRRLVADGATLRDKLRDVVHGTADRRDYPKDDGKRWLQEAGDHRDRITKRVVQEGDFAGWNALDQAVLAETGVAAPATIIDIRDTGMTVNDQPRALIVFRVDGPDGTFELSRKVLVSRVTLPRVGERVTVYYDARDSSKFTFRLRDLTDDPIGGAAPADPVEQLAKLAALHESGALSADEFAAAKQRLLADI